MDAGAIYHFLFETFTGIGILVAAGLVISLILCVILERKTRSVYKDRGPKTDDEWSLFDDDDDEEEEETAEKLEAQVFALDGEVDDMEREIETLCTKLLLKQQPVAADLRRITAALKMVTDLERIGDQASDIAELARFIRKGGKHEHLHEMAREVIRMVSDAVEAFVHLDLAQARAVIAYDDVVDRWFNQIKSDLVEQIAADKSTGEELLDIFMVAKYLERIGDHATNLAEWVEYAQTGARSKNGHWISPEAQATGWI